MVVEEWKDIKGYEGVYQVSNLGKVKSLKYGKERILKTRKTSKGYLMVDLHENGRPRCVYIHRLVAEAFIPNPLNLPQVNHKDECKYNNDVTNLEWCDAKYNMNYGTAIQRRSKVINQYTLDGEFIRQWISAYEIQREIGYYQQGICMCCTGKRNSAYGFIWRYKI